MAKNLRGKTSRKQKSGRTQHSGTGRGGTRHSGKAASGRATGVGRRHTHKFTIGDPDAFVTLMEKNTAKLNGPRRERLLSAVQDATRRFKASSSKERDAFLHGLVTGYAVAFKMTGEDGRGSSASPPPSLDASAAAGGL